MSLNRILLSFTFLSLAGCAQNHMSKPPDNYSSQMTGTLVEKLLYDPVVIHELHYVSIANLLIEDDSCYTFKNVNLCIDTTYFKGEITSPFMSMTEDGLDKVSGDVYLPTEGKLMKHKRKEPTIYPASNRDLSEALKLIFKKYRNIQKTPFARNSVNTKFLQPVETDHSIYQEICLSHKNSKIYLDITIAFNRKTFELRDYSYVLRH